MNTVVIVLASLLLVGCAEMQELERYKAEKAERETQYMKEKAQKEAEVLKVYNEWYNSLSPAEKVAENRRQEEQEYNRRLNAAILANQNLQAVMGRGPILQYTPPAPLYTPSSSPIPSYIPVMPEPRRSLNCTSTGFGNIVNTSCY